MGAFGRFIARLSGKKPMSQVVNSGEYKAEFMRRVDARYDAAGVSRANDRYWLNADHLAPNASLSPEVRRKTRSRARYELENCSFARSMSLGIATHMIGTGPRLQMLTSDRNVNQKIESAWSRWASEICLASKLRTMRKARVTDGSAFAQMMTNRRLRHDVKLDLQLIEDDQIATPTFDYEPRSVDGIKYDEFGNAISFEKLKVHPGTDDWYHDASYLDSDVIPAQYMLHSYRIERPGQVRGISEIASVLPLFAMLRRYQIATLAAAETAANFAAIMYSDFPAGQYEYNDLDTDWMNAVPIDFGQMVTLPAGWKAGQLRAEHPTSTYEMFNRAIKSEIALSLLQPYNIAAADSSKHNFSSGRLDMLIYIRFLLTERDDLEHQCLEQLFEAWLKEYLAVKSGIPSMDIDLSLVDMDQFRHNWHWDAAEFELDPVKAARAEEIRLGSTTTLHQTLNRKGVDYDAHIAELMKETGLTEQQLQERRANKWYGPAAATTSPELSLPVDDMDDVAEEVVSAIEAGGLEVSA